ncbi:MAG: LysR family transcriptional regulator [Granulosicoccus sp.]|nr:LysR family transcriptional regulator [Granulosicoccus sp.]
MNETNFDWDDLRLFLAVARQGGLAGAASQTGKSAPTLGRRMLALEEHLGQELFERQPRGYLLTDQGRALLEAATEVENGINPLVIAASGNSIRRIKISAGHWVTHLLASQASALVKNEQVVLQFLSADHMLDISHREAVIGIRNQRPTQPSLAGRQTQKVRFAVYARNRQVTKWVRVLGTTPSAQWVDQQTKNAHCVEISQPRNALDLASAGVARAVLPTFIGDRAKNLIRVSDEIEELEHMQWLVTHHEERHRPEVRRVIDAVYRILVNTEDQAKSDP